MGGGHRGTYTPQDLLLPEGKLIRTTRGGPNALKQLLLDLKKYSFSGYVRTVRGGGGKRSEGIVLLRGGNPEASLYHRDGTQDRGRSALKKVWQDSYDESCVLELHARVDMDGLVREYTDAILERPAKVVKKTKIPQTMERSEIEKQIRAWKDKGYEVSSVESNLDAEPSILSASVVAMRDGVKKAEAVGEMLAGLDVTGFESRAAILREKLKDPVRHPDIDTEVESLRDAVESLRQIEARRQVELERGRDSQARTRKVLDLVMKQQQALRPQESPYSSEDIARKVLEESLPVRDAATNLVQTYTFESFIVGESNRFAHGAAVAVAKQPAKEYNPLLITSGPGLGKTHLLHAIGNYVASHSKESKVLYMTCETFASNLANAKEVGTLSSFRERMRGMDCLLIDDIQFLSGMPEIHEELFYTFNDLHDTQKQIVLASDRPPKAIPNLDQRLVSRFESGLVAGIEPPDLLMRVTILERRARDENVSIEAEVLTCIANLVDNNVRELGGAFNRVVAFSSLMNRPITQDLAREVLSGATAEPSGEPTPQPVSERIAERDEGAARPPISSTINHELTPGRSYLIEEERPAKAFRLLTDFLGGGGGGLVITRTNPKRVRQGHDLSAERVLWLTDREGSAEETIAPTLERIVYEIEDFMGKQPRGAILLDGIEYLVSNNSFDAVLMFVRRLLDAISESRYAFIISLGPATLKDQELKVLEREMEVIRFP
jgi:chromosomal replication initiator protein DnaA